MGDIITVVSIEFLYNELFQIDLHNETKNENNWFFIKKEELKAKLKSAIERGANK